MGKTIVSSFVATEIAVKSALAAIKETNLLIAAVALAEAVVIRI